MIINDEFAKEVLEGLERSVERLNLKVEKINRAIAQVKEQIK